ncbi:hypothetical protein LMG8526HA_00203 [Lactococcus lactis]|uniref:DUF1642 domain-containing protein n=1 Tax=Lactococcus lactis TaxID=1358 RepID=UPI00071D2284|nr:DUF1642 domain-containing protein [Lactococcus lactis]KSU12975.1 hypothetical protein LMG8526_0360 [Lactococcus lactis subsp. lactis]MDU0399366.1 hypothetical protein [Lactococcus lactis]
MTKFEEELNKIEVEVQTPLDKYIVEKATSDESLYAQHYEAVLEKFKDWHSDEDYQKAKRMVEHVQVENEMLKAKLKSQQQALPVVPECVGEFVSGDEAELSKADRIAYLLKSVEGDNYYLEEYLTNAGIISQEQGEHLYAWATNQTHETILELWNGYTVEKPQLFYLRDELTGQFLAKDNQFKDKDRYFFWTGADPLTHSIGTAWKLSFTQQEIDSMETGSYELVPVEDGE